MRYRLITDNVGPCLCSLSKRLSWHRFPNVSAFLEHGDLSCNGLAVTPEHIHEDDDRSSHASSSDWTPQPQIGKRMPPLAVCKACAIVLRFSVKFGTGSYSFIQQHIRETDPRAILRDLLPDTVLPPDLDDMTLWQIIINISEPPKRKKRKDVNTLEDVVKLLKESKRILVLTGAGVRSAVWMMLS